MKMVEYRPDGSPVLRNCEFARRRRRLSPRAVKFYGCAVAALCASVAFVVAWCMDGRPALIIAAVALLGAFSVLEFTRWKADRMEGGRK